jgi:hypothetical protein
MQTWHDSKYGRFLRVCSHSTLNELRGIWKAYDTSDLSENERKFENQRFKLGIKKALDMKVVIMGHSIVLTGCRSAAPMTVQSAEDLSILHQNFWDHGSTDKERVSLSRAKNCNPMFAPLLADTCTVGDTTMHYSLRHGPSSWFSPGNGVCAADIGLSSTYTIISEVSSP